MRSLLASQVLNLVLTVLAVSISTKTNREDKKKRQFKGPLKKQVKIKNYLLSLTV